MARGLERNGATSSRRFLVVADVFRDESGFTTIGAAVAILLSCSLLFFGLWSARSTTRSAGVQSVADACALAAQNEVGEFVLSVRVADATLLTMSLTGISLLGIGAVCCCVPGAEAAGVKLLDSGRTIIQKREDVARVQERTLNAAQSALPLAAQTQAQLVVSENSETIDFDALAYVELVPSDAPAVSCGVGSSAKEAADAAINESGSIVEGAKAAEQAAAQASEALREAWLADCGAYPSACMRERAESLADMDVFENPMANSPNSWSFSMALKRARAYYRHRVVAEAPQDSSVEERARSALRLRFYRYAQGELDKAHAIQMPDGTVDVDLPLLPKNADEMKATDLYTADLFPASNGKLHAWEGCPGVGGVDGSGSLAQLDAGAFSKCEECGLDAAAMGSVAAASTSIDNGFEYHFRAVAEAARTYQQAKNDAIGQSAQVKDAIGGLLDMLNSAIEEAAGNRVEAYPPGCFGSLAALSGTMGATAETPFFQGPDLGSYAAVSAAILVEDSDEDALSNLLSGVEDDIGPPLSDGGETVLKLWSAILGAYGTGVEGLASAVSGVLDAIPLASASGLGDWASGALLDMLEAAGLEPANTAAAKPVTSNTLPVAMRGDGPVAAAIRSLKGDGS